MTNPCLEAALLLEALDHPICLCHGKNPGIFGGGWDEIEWTAARIEKAFERIPTLSVGYKLGPRWSCVIDIEQDSEQAKEDWLRFTDGVELPPTPSWPSKRGSHALWKLTKGQFKKLALAGATSVHKYGELEFRLGAEGRTVQSIIPPSTADGFTRAWSVSIADADIAPLPPELFDRLLQSAIKAPTRPAPTEKAQLPLSFGNRPGDIFNQRATWEEILTPLGWECETDYGDVKHWCRPGKSDAISATTGHCFTDCRPDCLYVFSTAPEIEPFKPHRTYSKFEAYGVINHPSDDLVGFRAADAAKDLAGKGYTPPKITNFKLHENEKGKLVPVPLSMPEILANAREALGGWPRRLDVLPFVDDGKEFRLFDQNRTAGIFGWMRNQCDVEWKSDGSFTTKDEFISEFTYTAPTYKSIESWPHEPLISEVYYRNPSIESGNGKTLEALLNRYNPETTADKQFTKAALMTLFWGGLPGKRPLFVLTSDEGRGVGKTKLVETLVYVTGEKIISVDGSEDMGEIKTRLLSKDGRRVRAFLFDNVKTRNLSWAALESLLTAHDISGHQMYFGEGSRRNLLTYFLTFNAASLSRDMAQRSVLIKVVRGTYSGTWEQDIRDFIDANRPAIIADILGALRAKRTVPKEYTRRGEWEHDILCRLTNPDELQAVLKERENEADTDTETSSLLEDYFADRLREVEPAYDPDTAQVRIPVETVIYWYNAALGIKEKTISASKAIRQMIKEGDLKRLQIDPSRTHGRNFIWSGANADPRYPISNDFNKRISSFIG